MVLVTNTTTPQNPQCTKFSTKISSPIPIKQTNVSYKNIIANNLQCSNKSDTLKFIPYYRSNTITKLITGNNQGPPTPQLKKTKLIYQYQCFHGDCEHAPKQYLHWMTTTTLSRRLTMHLASGGPKQQALANHNLPLTRADIVNNTKILITEFNHNKSLKPS